VPKKILKKHVTSTQNIIHNTDSHPHIIYQTSTMIDKIWLLCSTGVGQWKNLQQMCEELQLLKAPVFPLVWRILHEQFTPPIYIQQKPSPHSS
jgi:hypothetical protein